MDVELIRSRIAKLAPWHFKIELAPGLYTAEESQEGVQLVRDTTEMLQMLKHLHPNGLHGKSFLDVACNAGAYCFMAHDLGASHCFGFDIREHWIDQAEFVKELKYPKAEIEFTVADAKTFSSSRPFDVTLFKGIFYHLPDPVSTLKLACDMTSELIIVDTATWPDAPEDCIRIATENTHRHMSGVDGVTWMPGGPAALKPLLNWMGFPHTRVHKWIKRRDLEPGKRGNKRGRMCVLAAREVATFKNYDSASSTAQQ